MLRKVLPLMNAENADFGAMSSANCHPECSVKLESTKVIGVERRIPRMPALPWCFKAFNDVLLDLP